MIEFFARLQDYNKNDADGVNEYVAEVNIDPEDHDNGKDQSVRRTE